MSELIKKLLNEITELEQLETSNKMLKEALEESDRKYSEIQVLLSKFIPLAEDLASMGISEFNAFKDAEKIYLLVEEAKKYEQIKKKKE